MAILSKLYVKGQAEASFSKLKGFTCSWQRSHSPGMGLRGVLRPPYWFCKEVISLELHLVAAAPALCVGWNTQASAGRDSTWRQKNKNTHIKVEDTKKILTAHRHTPKN